VPFAIDRLHSAHNGLITPRALLTPEIISAYEAELASYASALAPERDWEICQAQLIELITNGGDEEAILMSPMTPFPPWFRVLYPEFFNHEIFDVWGDEALSEFTKSGKLRAFARKVAGKRFTELEQRWGRFVDSLERDLNK
jgi:hypothetical protein